MDEEDREVIEEILDNKNLGANKISATFACMILSGIISKQSNDIASTIVSDHPSKLELTNDLINKDPILSQLGNSIMMMSSKTIKRNNDLLLIYKKFIEDNPLKFGENLTDYEMLAKNIYDMSTNITSISTLGRINSLINTYRKTYPNDAAIEIYSKHIGMLQLLGVYGN